MSKWENLKYSDFSVKLQKKLEKAKKTLQSFIWNGLRLRTVAYFVRHINPLYKDIEEEKDSLFFRIIRNIENFGIGVAVTGFATNFVLNAFFNAVLSVENTLAFGLAWWLLEQMIIKKGFDYYMNRKETVARIMK